MRRTHVFVFGIWKLLLLAAAAYYWLRDFSRGGNVAAPSRRDLTRALPGPRSIGPPLYVRARSQLESLQKADPGFRETAFLTAASKTYAAALAAECGMNPDHVASSVTPAFLDRLKQKVAGWRDAGSQRVVSDVALDGSTIFKAEIGAADQSITVRFTGRAKRYTKADTSGLVIDGGAQRAPFTEFATFTRPAGSTTPAFEAQGTARHCPSCGAPSVEGAFKCAFCGISLIGTGGTWLLSRVSASAYT